MENRQMVAIIYNGTQVEKVAKVQNVNDSTFKELKAKENKCEEDKLQAKEKNEKAFAKLKHHIEVCDYFLAKATYDNFVEHGQIDIDEDFEQAWFDYVFSGETIKEFPENYVKILERIISK